LCLPNHASARYGMLSDFSGDLGEEISQGLHLAFWPPLENLWAI
jgi:hypothetical protein